ncbi:Putative Mg2+ and Co2+ transporter CorB [Actinomyces bovis]|uniref:Mg2+ and Co2+ transporter CorB n=1 Tax=Actinomyces bovis TaxID=1658 RepID=A0ABY1VPK4_9ACTO|nr:hemolysin family protein [Actinomyces bovis]SPT53382.1 Putative Mg2+ and Co2+ transporter CorB [Actinomyces bovis]VEG52780.1 Putative Mg2+ and Co2+ transporter CorB [Actinomyces israelii]
MSTPVALVTALVLLLGNAFFVGAEFAVTSARRAQLEPLAEAGDRRAKTALWALQHVSSMLATAQLGVTVCSTGLGVVAEPAVAHLLQPAVAVLGLGAASAHGVAVVFALVLVIFMHVVAGEMVPKNISIASPETAVRWLAPPLVALSHLLRPVIAGLNGLANGTLRRFGLEPREELPAAFNAAEVAAIVERSTAEGVLEDETGLLSTALEFSEATAASVMVPLAELVTLPAAATPADVEHAVATTGFSRFPTVDEAGEVIGYLHLKDVLYADAAQRNEPVPAGLLRQLVRVRPDDEVEDALLAMQRTGAHLGWVEGDAGQLLGVVFLEDIIEELVGEVHDEMQREEHQRRDLL